MSTERRQFVNIAVRSASSALELILNDVDMRRAVIGVPLYLLTTIAYACMFLMKAQSQWKSANLDICYDDVVSLMERTVGLLVETHACVRHVAHYIGRGLNSMLEKFKDRATQEQLHSSQPMAQHWAEGEMGQDWNHWMFGGDMMDQISVGPQYPLSLLDVLNSQMPG